MTTLAIALAQSPIHAAWTHGSEPQSVVEVRALLIDRHAQSDTPLRALRYELLTNGAPQVVGSYTEIVEMASFHRAPEGDWATLAWQPVYERAPLAPPRTARHLRQPLHESEQPQPRTRGW